VLGELVAGIVLSALPGVSFFRDLGSDPAVDVLARLGAIVLLFDAGLLLRARDVFQVGRSAARVAGIGTAASLVLGWAAASLILPARAPITRAFLAAALASTSVGISARVLKDLGRSQSVEGRTVLGAAVIDDVLGLVVLSVVTGWGRSSATESQPGWNALLLVGKTVVFFVGALIVGHGVAPHMLRLAARLRTRGALVVVGLAFCFFLSWAADAIGLAAILGAFTAGLVLEEAHWSELIRRGDRGLDQEMEPLVAFLVPIFFTLLGIRTNLRAFAEPGALVLAAGLTVAAVFGKLACGAGALRGSNRLAVSFGMMPRGEVGLIIASLGMQLREGGAPVLDAPSYSAIVMMIVVTTLITPIGLKWSFTRGREGDA
jgi:Kef-type K+ transport system membrane component KefB